MKLQVNVPGKEYEILCERGLLDRAGEHLKGLLSGQLCAVVTDSNVGPLYADRVVKSLESAGFRTGLITIPAGEKSKNPEMLLNLWNELIEMGITRSDTVIALGGGVVGDLAGFAAASILRGVRFVQIPTSLLAQVDSSVGGKVAIDLPSGKNLAGAFWQPAAVLIDPGCLDTLSDRVFNDGMGEVIKYGAIRDAELFAQLDRDGGRAGVMSHIGDVILRCCDIKRATVVEDELDNGGAHGGRLVLNYGHTFGHVYEQTYGFETYTHGEGVAAGMVTAARIGEKMGITPAGTADRICAVLEKYDLPCEIRVTEEEVRHTIGKDKKNRGAKIHFIYLKELGDGEDRFMLTEELINTAFHLHGE